MYMIYNSLSAEDKLLFDTLYKLRHVVSSGEISKKYRIMDLFFRKKL